MLLSKVSLSLSLALACGLSLHAAEFTRKAPSQPASASAIVDVDLGESPVDFAVACWKQLKGETLSAADAATWAAKLGTPEAPRRIDLAILMAKEAGVTPKWTYSDPWEKQISLDGAPTSKVKRQIGAVMMFFFTCPKNPNGTVHWANNHVAGMDQPSPLYGFGDKDAGFYHPENSGFWYREFKDAEYAGISFLMPNMYGPDWKPAVIDALKQGWGTLKAEDGEATPKIALFDDSWSWGQPFFGEFWKQVPDLSKTDEAARLLYDNKWKKFFTDVPKEAWFTIGGRPLIYFYNAGTLKPQTSAAAVIAKMKELFKADFGIEPFVAVDRAFFADRDMPKIADSQFRWVTFDSPGSVWLEKSKGVNLAHAMIRWDSVNRDNANTERLATKDDRLIKDDHILVDVLNATRDNDYLILATWNDLGEGTGLNRCYDYYWDGSWKTPDHFLKLIRRSQEGETLKP